MCPEIAVQEENVTNLSGNENLEEDIRNVVVGSPQSDIEERTDRIKGRRLYKHVYDGLVQPAGSGRCPQSFPEVPSM